ncbi:hypothetical protein [methane-oxidizing endosymbiont of Gigantopelta aegis]|uniref:hypothetical protein n=1 Tax=methane-oxidizing endosymbiont of Gigantopelta aegis TaxID=2794938 RepID=UPI0018DEABE3|nr:hypothetical protein [methane-oxidizing endosymbiont of Gigantopelta aegis]
MIAQRIPQWIQEGEQRGEARGEVRGEANTLLKQLNLKFGVLPAWVEQRVNAADKKQLDVWVARILTEDTLEKIFL